MIDQPSPTAKDSPKPKITDQFWFDLSEKMISGAMKSLDEAAIRLHTLVTWTSTLLSGSTLIAFYLNNVENWLIYVTPLPFIFLALGATFSFLAQMPVPVTFDSRIPDKIKEAYSNTFNKRVQRLNLARICVVSGTILTGFIICYSFAFTRDKAIEDKAIKDSQKEIYFETYYDTTTVVDQLAITGHLPPKVPIRFRISCMDTTKKEIYLIDSVFVNTSSGEFMKSFPVNYVSDKYKLLIDWKNPPYSHSWAKEIIKPKRG